MASHDVNGREYLKLTDAKHGQEIELDEDFSCTAGGKSRIIMDKKGEAYFPCNEVRHYIRGQCWDNDGYCVGVYPVTPSGTRP